MDDLVYWPDLAQLRVYVIATLIWGAVFIGLHIFYYCSEPANRRFPPRKLWLGWSHSREGRDWMSQKVGIFAFILFWLSIIFFGNYPGSGILAIVILTHLAAMFMRFFVNLRRTQIPDETRLRACWKDRATPNERKTND